MAEKVWADLGPTLAESPRNPNENCFTLVVDAEEYDALAARLAEVEAARQGLFLQKCDLRAQLAEAEAKIDALMLEYCPDEMTQEQVDRWMAHQVAAESAAAQETESHG